uniref:KASH domain-containing protein n=1 Tax=Syphacia muris TaxID=451379 RepID=A0A0N5AFX2_9BILA
MAFPEGKVQHTLLYGDLLERIMCLECALDLGSETSSSERCCSVGFASPCGSGCAGSVDVKDSPSDVNVSDGDVVNVDGAVESDVEGESVTLSFESDESVSDAVEAVDSGFGRSRWRRVLRAALPLQAMLVLLLGAACLVPHCDDEYCCQLLNNFAHSLDPSLHFIDGPPPI